MTRFLVEVSMCFFFPFLAISMVVTTLPAEGQNSAALQAVRTIIEAVNTKDADKYASVFAEESVVQLYQGPVRISGRADLRRNRAEHFKRFPDTHSEIVSLVEIGDVVVMHDRVRLDQSAPAADIVEIYTFRDGLIVRVDVIQPRAVSDRLAPAHRR